MPRIIYNAEESRNGEQSVSIHSFISVLCLQTLRALHSIPLLVHSVHPVIPTYPIVQTSLLGATGIRFYFGRSSSRQKR
jgi:hypothetical protein